MEKTGTLNLRVNPRLKKEAESILSQLGIPMSTAIDIFLNQVVLVGGLPFFVTLPRPPRNVDASQMSDEEIVEKMNQGYQDYLNGHTKDAKETFEEFRERKF